MVLLFQPFTHQTLTCYGARLCGPRVVIMKKTSFMILTLFAVQRGCEAFVCVLSRSVVSDSLRPHGLYVALQAPLSMGFSRQEYWSG